MVLPTIDIEDTDWVYGEQFTQGDIDGLQMLVKKVSHPNALFAEVGSWKGFSSFVISMIIKGTGSILYAIDHWQGSPKTWMENIAEKEDIFSTYKKNLTDLGHWGTVRPMMMESEVAARIFADNVLDLIFIDANHLYEGIKQDIKMWFPKVKKGGIICGHDCEGLYSQYSGMAKQAIDENWNFQGMSDWIPKAEFGKNARYYGIGDEIGLHAGVIKAVHEKFGDKYKVAPNSKVWYYNK